LKKMLEGAREASRAAEKAIRRSLTAFFF